MRSRRPLTSLTLIAGALVLLVAIAIGQRLGESVLRTATDEREPAPNAFLTPVPMSSEEADTARNWKREQVVSVATDPAFPDPRVTKPPTPKPKPTPAPTPPPPTPAPTDGLRRDEGPTAPPYTSPPLPIPIASHAPTEVDTDPPDANGFPQGIPPAPTPSP